MEQPFVSCGKQVLRNGQDYAQARDPEAAQLIADAMNHAHPSSPAPEPTLFPVEPIAPLCRAYQASDQMICPCGMQWDINDPDPPACGR